MKKQEGESQKIIWKKIENFPGYQISNNGLIKSFKSNKILKYFDSTGYYKVSLCNKGRVSKHFVHRLIAEYFIPNPKGLPTVNHKDGNKKNNSIANLEWSCYTKQELHKNRIVNKRKRGVSFYKNSWTAQITINCKKIHLGRFKSKKAAYNAYKNRYIKEYGVNPW